MAALSLVWLASLVLERLCQEIRALQGRIAALQPVGAVSMVLPQAGPPDMQLTQ